MSWQHPEITDAIRRALAEDIGSGDITTEACVDEDQTAEGFFLTREPLVLAGVEIIPEIYSQERVELLQSSGDQLDTDTVVARVSGSARRLLPLERTALNFLQRLSGVATLARQFVDAVEGTRCKVLDTRKTTPGLRRLEKLAARAGGIVNHRLGLFDAILIKNNHITAAGGVRQALAKTRSRGHKVEIEVRTFDELKQALEGGAGHLLLDNFTVEQVREAVAMIAGRAVIEVSGGMRLDNVRGYAEAGAGYVSAGAITHSAPAVDISFRLR